jgi:hypothetical protein
MTDDASSSERVTWLLTVLDMRDWNPPIFGSRGEYLGASLHLLRSVYFNASWSWNSEGNEVCVRSFRTHSRLTMTLSVVHAAK